jgi:AcrR family transcriptional regulator
LDIFANSLKKNKYEEMKEHIITSYITLMKKYGHENLTIRNICSSSGISTGTFYHYFSSKDELMSYYLARGYEKYRQFSLGKMDNLNPTLKVISVLVCICQYFLEAGPAFIINYISPRNQALNSRNTEGNQRQIVHDLVEQIDMANHAGLFKIEDTMMIYNDVNRVFFGVLFDWCLSNGDFDLIPELTRMLVNTLNFYLNDPISAEMLP